MRFLGNIEAKVDAKNRVFVPAVFRRLLEAERATTPASHPEALANATTSAAVATAEPAEAFPIQLYLRKDVYQDCIVVYPASVWEEELTALRAKLNKWVPEEQDLYRQFMLEAEAVEMDANGRILISRRLLNLVGISSQVRFLGVDNTMEIWPKQSLESPRVATEDFKRQMQHLMGKKEI